MLIQLFYTLRVLFRIFCIFEVHAEIPQCTYCHIGNQSKIENFTLLKKTSDSIELRNNCALCHVNLFFTEKNKRQYNWTPHIVNLNPGKFNEKYLYAKNPALNFVIEGNNRFTDCGLKKFLANPVPRRYKSLNSMFPISPIEIEKVIKENKISLEPCSEQKDIAAYTQGEKTFKQNCIICHSDNENKTHAPRLRVGYPLFSKKYFIYRVQHGFKKTAASDFVYQYYWKEINHNLIKNKMAAEFLMPDFKKLSLKEINNLYQYVSFSNQDINSIQIPDGNLDYMNDPTALFLDVQKNIFDTSCRHCHTQSSHGAALINKVLGKTQNNSIGPLVFPASGTNIKATKQLSLVLSPTNDCGPSPLVNILWERHLEVKGHKNLTKPGMPINLSPIPINTITHLQQWSNMGCPSPVGWLCKACDKGKLVK